MDLSSGDNCRLEVSSGTTCLITWLYISLGLELERLLLAFIIVVNTLAALLLSLLASLTAALSLESLAMKVTLEPSKDGSILFTGLSVLGTIIPLARSEEHTSELQSLMRISYAVFCLKKKNTNMTSNHI